MKRLVSFILLFSGLRTYAQQLHFEQYSVNDGLPGSQVYDIVQDRNGYIWFATDRGICRYNGYVFENFGINEGLTDNAVLGFYPQKDGKIWCATFNKKLFHFDPSDVHFVTYPYNDHLTDIPNATIINSLYVSEDSTIYLGFIGYMGYLAIDAEGKVSGNAHKNNGENEGVRILQCSPDGENHFSFLSADTSGLPFNGIDYQVVFSDQVSFYKTAALPSHGLALFADVDKVVLLKGDEELKLSSEYHDPIGTGFINQQKMWASYRYKGLFFYDQQGKLLQTCLEGMSITDVFIDHEDGMWISTLTSGVFYTRNQHLYVHAGKQHKNVTSLAADKFKNLYAGFYNGDVLLLKDDGHRVIHHSEMKRPSQVEYIHAWKEIVYYSDYDLFRQTEAGSRKVAGHNSVLRIADGKNDHLLIGGYGNVWELTPDSTIGLDTERANDVCKVNDRYYVGSLHGVFEYHLHNRMLLSDRSKLLSYRTNDIDYNNGKFYMATMGAGLVVMTPDSIFNISVREGLYSDFSAEVYIENDSTVWLCGNAGLNRIVFSTPYRYTVSGISNADGLIDNDVTDVEIIDSIIWVGTRSGLCSFPKSLLQKERYPRYLTVRKVKVNDELWETTTEELEHDQNRLEISYQAISFKNNRQLKYRYRMEGLEENWNHTSSLRAIYPSLPPGQYRFMLEVGDEKDQQYTERLAFPIVIRPPFYATWWFITLLVLMLVLVIYLFFRVRLLIYNRDLVRELLRQILKKIRKETAYLVLKEQRSEVKIDTSTIYYIKSDGNYLEVHTTDKVHVVRCKMNECLHLLPDPLEYLRIHRSYTVRLDKITKKSNRSVTINGRELPIGKTYRGVSEQIQF